MNLIEYFDFDTPQNHHTY